MSRLQNSSGQEAAAAALKDLKRRLHAQEEEQAALKIQTLALEKERDEAVQRGKTQVEELKKQLDDLYAEQKKRMDALATQNPLPIGSRARTGYLIDFSSVPVFSGEGDDGVTVEDFLCAVEGVVSFHDLGSKDIMGLLRTKTRRAARLFAEKLPATERANMEALEKAFLKEFKIPTSRNTLESQFSECRQKEFEEVADYYQRLRGIAHQLEVATPTPDGVDENFLATLWEDRRVNRFIAGLRPELKRALVGREPKTMQEARTMALAAEEVETSAELEQEKSSVDRSRISNLFSDDTYRQRLRDLKQEELALLEARVQTLKSLPSAPKESADLIPSGQRVDWKNSTGAKFHKSAYHFNSDGSKPRDYKCILCGQKGHFASACPLSICGLCRQKGHFPKDCPSTEV